MYYAAQLCGVHTGEYEKHNVLHCYMHYLTSHHWSHSELISKLISQIMGLVVKPYITQKLSVSHLHLDQQRISSVGFGIIGSGELLAIRQTFHSLSCLLQQWECSFATSSDRQTQKNPYLYLWPITDLNVLKLFTSMQSMSSSSMQKSCRSV